MAIIKPEAFKGVFPYWWQIRVVEKDEFHVRTKVTLSLFHSAEAYIQDKLNNILFDVAVDIPGIDLTNQFIYEWLVENNERFRKGIATPENYVIDVFKSPVWVNDPNPDIKNGLKRSIEGIYYLTYLNSKRLILALRVHFYPKIQVPNPDYIEQIDGEGNVINADSSMITVDSEDYDPSKDIDFALEVDNFYEVQPGVGELDYFNSLMSQGMSNNEIIIQGIQYGLLKGYINKRLYGIV